MGAAVDFLVPNRFEHGYGLTPELADMAAARGAQILLTVDNGIASLAGVARAQALGLEVIITDHHLPADTVPDCIIVNPNQAGCGFESKNLAGVGVIFYVLMALRADLRARGGFSNGLAEPNLGSLLDLVALGTVADVVALDHNNRILVSQGLKRMRAGNMRPGIRALFGAKRSLSIWALRWGRASMPPAVSTICRWASPAFWPNTKPMPSPWPSSSTT
jgi:single-stranded-DNA-specific exonuclease